MLKSMTGFGRGEGETTIGKISIETRSVNHRFCDINIKLPKRFAPYEARMKEIIRAHVSRGRVDVSLKLDAVGENTVRLHVDLQLAEQYYKAIQILKEKLQFKDDIPLDLLVGAKDIIMAKEEVEDIEPYWQEVIPILKQSVKDMDQMKLSEGETLSRDLQQRLGRILRYLKEVKHQFPISLQAYWGRLNERVRSLLEGVELDPARFQQEIAILAERFDITEEVVRAESHLNQFETLLTSEEPVGRKMDFLLQEIHREMNTISSKANDAKISQAMVEIKSELEKIREQVQNIE
jgi:uncharacterized protein (TIGR00255 family)